MKEQINRYKTECFDHSRMVNDETILSEYEQLHAQRELAESPEYYDVLSYFTFKGLTLDIACGSGWIEQRDPTVIAIDFSINALKRTKERGGLFLIRSDAHKLPFRDFVFASCLCLGSLEHFRIPEQVLKEAHRVLKMNGIFVITPEVGHSLPYSLSLKVGMFLRRPKAVRDDFKKQPIEQKMKLRKILELIKKNGFETLFLGRYVGEEKAVSFYLPYLGFISDYLPRVVWHRLYFLISMKK